MGIVLCGIKYIPPTGGERSIIGLRLNKSQDAVELREEGADAADGKGDNEDKVKVGRV